MVTSCFDWCHELVIFRHGRFVLIVYLRQIAWPGSMNGILKLCGDLKMGVKQVSVQIREKAIKNGETNSDDLGNGRSRRPHAGDSSSSGSLAAAPHRRVVLPRRRPSGPPEARATCEEGGGRALSSSFSGSGRARPSGPPWWFAGGSCPPRRGWPGGHTSSLPAAGSVAVRGRGFSLWLGPAMAWAVPATGFLAQIHRPAPKGMSSK